MSTSGEKPVSYGFRGLRFKVAAATVSALILVMGTYFAISYMQLKKDLIANLGKSGTEYLGEVITLSFKHHMITQNTEELKYVMESVAGKEDVIRIMLFNKKRQVKASSHPELLGEVFDYSSSGCKSCHLKEYEVGLKYKVITVDDDTFLRTVQPILNEKACYGCHDRTIKINGVFITDFSLSAIKSDLAHKIREMLFSIIITCFVSGTVIVLLLNRAVTMRVQKLLGAVEKFGGGDMSSRAAELSSSDELAALTTSFNRMADSLEQAVKVKQKKEFLENVLKSSDDLYQSYKLAAIGQLAANVAHEINNPLSNMLLNAQLIMEDIGPSHKSYPQLSKVVDNIMRSKKIVGELLDFTRKNETRFETLNINDIVNRAAVILEHQFMFKSVKLEMQLADNLPKVRCDSGQIEQVIVNLLMNAVEVSGKDETVFISTCSINEGRTIELVVEDNGPGIPKENMEKIFDPFFTTRKSGTGLGLPICRGIANRHNGTLSVITSTDRKGKRGTKAILDLPAII